MKSLHQIPPVNTRIFTILAALFLFGLALLLVPDRAIAAWAVPAPESPRDDHAVSAPTNACITYVDADSAAASPDGSSWASAYPILQDALHGGLPCETIWVAEGLYYPDEGGASSADVLTSTFQLLDGVTIYGGFAGDETSLDERDWQANPTVLSGDIDHETTPDITDANGVVTATANIKGSNAYHVVNGSGIGPTAVLDGFFITGGSAFGPFTFPCDATCGGGVYNRSGSPTLTNLVISGNQGGSGGGIYNSLSSPRITNVTVTANYGGDAGGIGNFELSHPVIRRVSIHGNRAYWNGGGMWNHGGSRPELVDVSFTGNEVINGTGGAVTISGSGGNFTNVHMTGNKSLQGGAIYMNSFSNPVLTNVTIAGNYASIFGGALALLSSSNPLIQNSIIWGNDTGGDGVEIYNDGGNPTFAYSLVRTCYPEEVWSSDCGINGGDNLTDTLPLFANPLDASLAPTTGGDYTLQADSPAINVGDNDADLDGANPNTVVISDIPTDLAGNLRISEAVVDLGAYEFQRYSLFLPLIVR